MPMRASATSAPLSRLAPTYDPSYPPSTANPPCYEDTRTAQTAALAHGAAETPGGSNLDRMNAELQDVTRIMTKNMEDLLWRGDSLDRKLVPAPCASAAVCAVRVSS
jgi:hypothetical protein